MLLKRSTIQWSPSWQILDHRMTAYILTTYQARSLLYRMSFVKTKGRDAQQKW